MSVQQFTATFLGATRQKNSVNGNPVWIVHTSIGDMKSEPDSHIGHRIGSFANPDGPDSLMGVDVLFTVFRHRSMARWVTNIQPPVSNNRL